MAQQQEREQQLDFVTIFRKLVSAMLTDDELTIPTESAKRTLRCANCLVELLANEQHVRDNAVFFSNVLDEVTKVIQVKDSINKKKLFKGFHKLCTSGKFVSL